MLTRLAANQTMGSDTDERLRMRRPKAMCTSAPGAHAFAT
jgi:hypothetical protein